MFKVILQYFLSIDRELKCGVNGKRFKATSRLFKKLWLLLLIANAAFTHLAFNLTFLFAEYDSYDGAWSSWFFNNYGVLGSSLFSAKLLPMTRCHVSRDP